MLSQIMPIHPNRSIAVAIGAVVLSGVAAFPAVADLWSWPHSFTEGSAVGLTDLHGALAGQTLQDLGVPVENLRWEAQGFEIVLQTGALWLEPAVDGERVGAYFEGRGTVRFSPTGKRARGETAFWFGAEQLEPTEIQSAYFFTLRGKDLAEQLGIRAEPSVSLTDVAGYGQCKRAFRQLGLAPLHAFLNREGRSRGATYVIFPLGAMRTGSDSDSLLLYSFDPARRNAVVLAAGGHDEIASSPFTKFYFAPIVHERSAKQTWSPQGRANSYTTRLSMPKRLNSADLETTIRFAAEEGLRGLALALNSRLAVRSVTTADGTSLPFAQWTFATDGVNSDPQLLIDFGTALPTGEEQSLTVTASGKLFAPFGPNWVLVDEDTWFPQLDDPAGAHYELTLEVPAKQVPVAPGERVSDEVADGVRTVCFRTKRAQNRSSVYVGPFALMEGEADGTRLEVYTDRNQGSRVTGYDAFMDRTISVRDVEYSQVSYSMHEIENALRVFKRILGPIDLEVLRVASTPTGHGRGFEGLLLLSKFGGFASDNSRADLFRAHEVAHLWWGNQIDVQDWRADRWLGESFAEYMAMEYYTIRFEKPEQTKEWMRESWVRPVLGAANEPARTLLGQKRRERGSELHPLAEGTNNVYTKGPLVLHMLRNLFVLFHGSDEKFWELLQDFLEQHKGQLVTNEDFMVATEAKLGGQIGWFWDQWIYGSELPHIHWSSTMTQADGGWQVDVTARQDGTSAPFTIALPVFVDLGKGRQVRKFLDLSGPTGSTTIRVPTKPASVSVNDNFEVLAFVDRE